MYAMGRGGVVASVHVRTMVRGGIIFLLLCCVCTNWKNVVGCLAIRFIAFIVNYLKFSISPSLN